MTSSCSNLVLQINSDREAPPACVISSSNIHDRLLGAEIRQDDSREELRDSVVSHIVVDSTDDNSYDNRQLTHTGPILHTPPTTSQLMKLRVKRFFSRIVHCRYDKRRLPTNKQVIILLLMCCFERGAYYAASTGPINALFNFSANENGVSVMVQDIIPQLLFPLAGWAGDVYLGRFKAIQIGLVLIALSCSSLLVETTVFYMVFSTCSNDLIGTHNSVYCSHFAVTACSIISFILLCAGSSLFQANLIPYGADLITFYRSSNDISSYFYWYYWARNICGPIISISSLCLLGLDNNFTNVLTCLAACICISIALVICFSTKHWFTNERLFCNPYKKSLQIISYALRAKRPRARAAFGIGHDPPPRLDLAKRRHGGSFTNEEVEDVKTVGRVILLILCFGSLNTIRTAADDGLGYQVGKITPVKVFAWSTGELYCSATQYYPWILESFLILLLVPLLDQVIYPILGEFTPSMLRRIGIGFCAVILCCAIELGIEYVVVATISRDDNSTSCDHDNHNLSSVFTGYYLLLIVVLPVLLVTMAEICGIVSGLCFVYAQSPSNTRGMMTGLFFAIAGVFSLLGDYVESMFITLSSFKLKLPTSQTCLFWYFLTILCLSLVGLAVYIVGARKYKNRHRGELETSEPYYFRPRFLNIWGNRRGQTFRDYREN